MSMNQGSLASTTGLQTVAAATADLSAVLIPLLKGVSYRADDAAH